MNVRHGGRSDVGVVRTRNEDSYLADPQCQLFVVCDGVGGRAGGAEASRIAVEHIGQCVARNRKALEDFADGSGQVAKRDIALLLERAISDASRRVRHHALANAELNGMATTAAALLIAGSQAFVAHVGDSRVYLIRNGVIHLLTEDHSLLNDMRKRGRSIAPGSIAASYQEALTRALGVLDTARVDLLDLEILPKDRFLLSSDGVHAVIGDELMQQIASTGETQSVADELIEAALQQGAPDNATALLVDVIDEAADDRAMRVRRRLEAIQSVTVFRYLPFADLMRVAGIAQELAWPAGQLFFREGEQGSAMYILLEGTVSLSKSDVELATLQPGAHFGEMALIERAPRSATVTARSDCAVLMIDREAFYGLLAEEQTAVKLLWGLVRMLNARLRLTTEELTSLKMGLHG